MIRIGVNIIFVTAQHEPTNALILIKRKDEENVGKHAGTALYFMSTYSQKLCMAVRNNPGVADRV